MGATEHWFYHLGRGTPQSALPPLLEKVLARGWRALVCAPEPSALEALDQVLWTWRPDSFLPHGLSSAPRAESQPVLLSNRPDNENKAQVVILLHGAPAPALEGVKRCITLFDDADRNALAAARERWKSLRQVGAACSYWRQDDQGRWSLQE